MAFLHDVSDSRSRSSRSHERSARPRDEPRPRSTAEPAPPSQRKPGEERPAAFLDVQPPSARYKYDPRYDYPPPPPPDTGRPGRPIRPTRSPNRHRPSWPPQPSCEEEAVSLAKEIGSQTLLNDIGKDEASSRGSIDQEPLIEDVPGFTHYGERPRETDPSAVEHESLPTGIPTPPTSEDERSRRIKKRPSRLKLEAEDKAPEVSRRTASPYAFSRPNKLHKDGSSGDQFLSPSNLTPPATDSHRQRSRFAASAPTSPGRGSGPDSRRISPSARQGSDYFRSRTAREDVASEHLDRAARRGAPTGHPPKPNRSHTVADNPSLHLQTSDFTPVAQNGPFTRQFNLDARGNTDTAGNLPSLPILKGERPRRQTPLMAPSPLSELREASLCSSPSPMTLDDVHNNRSREPNYTSSRNVSPMPETIRNRSPPRSPRSPRYSTEMPRDLPTTSSPTSKASSVTNSRPSSPSPRTSSDTTRLPRTDSDWSNALAANAARRTKPPSRLASSMRQESMPDVPRVDLSFTPLPYRHMTARPSSSGGLPYPVEDGPQTPTVFMPSERDHQHFTGGVNSTLSTPFMREAGKPVSHGHQPVPGPTSRSGERPARSSLPLRRSVTEVTSSEDRPKQVQNTRHVSSVSNETKKDLAALLNKGLPECSRSYPTAGYDDWYAVIGAPSIDICPSCVDSIFEKTIFRPLIRRSPPRNLNDKVQCAFGSSAWTRLAWLLTLQQQRTDLTLLKDLADIEDSSDPCPGSRESVCSWYGLRDHDGLFVRNFHVCHSDVRKIERLLPTLSGMFVRFPHRSSSIHSVCAVRAKGNRFSVYLDALIATHEKAFASRKGVDPMPFIELVERKNRLRECSRDNMLVGGLWHYIPEIPSLTVCEDCFEFIVEPQIKHSAVAKCFNQAIQPVYGETLGTSCQMYSPYMRNVFQRAVRDNDLKYLARKSVDRHEAELRLQERFKEVHRRARRLSREGSGSEEEERRLNKELERITLEWQTKWE